MLYPIETSRLVIQPLVIEDLEPFVSYRQDPEVARFQSWEPTYSKENALELIESQAGVLIPASGQWLQLGIHNLASDELIGDLAIHSVPESDRCFEIGFTISRVHQGQGFSKEAASALMKRMFTDQLAVKFIANTDSRNNSSIGVLRALGFKKDSRRSWSERFKNEDVLVEYFEMHG